MTRDGEVCSIGEMAIAAETRRPRRRPGRAGRTGDPPCIVDTVRSLTGSEDSSEPVSAYLRAVRRLMTRTPGAGWISPIMRAGRTARARRKRERGSSAWRGNCGRDAYLEAASMTRAGARPH